MKEEGNTVETKKKYVTPLKKLKDVAPKSKLDELEKLIQKMEPPKAPTPVDDAIAGMMM